MGIGCPRSGPIRFDGVSTLLFLFDLLLLCLCGGERKEMGTDGARRFPINGGDLPLTDGDPTARPDGRTARIGAAHGQLPLEWGVWLWSAWA
jgi:hypothetical protein